MERQAIQRKRSLEACGGGWPVANGESGARVAPGGDLEEAAAPLGVRGRGVNEGTGRVSLTPTLFDPGQNR
jgi:hypothetical protein